MQLGGVATRWNGRSIGAQNISSVAYSEARSVSTGSSLSVVRYAENDGQRRYVLRPASPVYIHFQVFKPIVKIMSYKSVAQVF